MLVAEFCTWPGAGRAGNNRCCYFEQIFSLFFLSPHPPPVFIFAQRVSCLIFRHDELCAKSSFAHSCRVSTLGYLGTTGW